MNDPYRSASHGDDMGTCPRCTDTAMQVMTFGSASVLACPACGGVFAARTLLDRVAAGDVASLRELSVEARFAPPRPRTTPVVLTCPSCHDAMRAMHIEAAGCTIDLCAAHGAWFDRWEVELVLDAIADPKVAEALR